MDKNYDNNLNVWFSIILGINAIVGVFAIGKLLWELVTNEGEGMSWFSFYDLAVQLVFVFGCVKLFFASRTGFYLIASVCLLNVMMGGWLYCQCVDIKDSVAQEVAQASAQGMVYANIGKIVFFMLLMLLRDKGKNAYEVLWSKK